MSSVELRFGCEFKFYVNEMLEEDLLDDLVKISKASVANLVHKSSQENDNDKINYKKDFSLTGNIGREITTPICSLEDLKKYIITISELIDEYGQTNEDMGFHIHISISQN